MDFTMTGHGVSVQFKVLRMGTDCLVLAAGGDTGHIGPLPSGIEANACQMPERATGKAW